MTMMMIRTVISAQHMSFRVFFCSFLASTSCVTPCCTWLRAFATCQRTSPELSLRTVVPLMTLSHSLRTVQNSSQPENFMLFMTSTALHLYSPSRCAVLMQDPDTGKHPE